MKSHKDLKVWQESLTLVEDVYTKTKSFPKDELFGLTSQIKRAVVSIPSNIAEGAGRKGPREFKRFLYIAMGSASELDTQIEIAVRLGFVEYDKNIIDKIYFIKNMLAKLIEKLDD